MPQDSKPTVNLESISGTVTFLNKDKHISLYETTLYKWLCFLKASWISNSETEVKMKLFQTLNGKKENNIKCVILIRNMYCSLYYMLLNRSLLTCNTAPIIAAEKKIKHWQTYTHTYCQEIHFNLLRQFKFPLPMCGLVLVIMQKKIHSIHWNTD